MIGNNPPVAMPVVQYAIGGKTTLGNEFYSYRHVAEKLVEHICPAPIDEKLARRLQEISRARLTRPLIAGILAGWIFVWMNVVILMF